MRALLEIFATAFREPHVVQRYLPEVRKGDKRIILIDGVVAGAINRVPAEGEARSNMHVGGRPEPTELTKREHEICETIGPELKRRGFIFVGIDVIGDYLTEINVTSPTGIREVKRFGGPDFAAMFWDAVEEKVRAKRLPRRRRSAADPTQPSASASRGSFVACIGSRIRRASFSLTSRRRASSVFEIPAAAKASSTASFAATSGATVTVLPLLARGFGNGRPRSG